MWKDQSIAPGRFALPTHMAQPFPKLAEIIGPLASGLAETPALASSGTVEARHILPRVEVGATGARIVDALALGEQRPLLVVDGRRLTVGEQLGSGGWRRTRMALLLDTRTLPAADRIEATNATLADTDVPAVFRYDTSRGQVGHRLDYWDLGPGTHITRIVGSGLGITRGPKQLRAAAPERIGLGFQLRIVTAFTHLDTDQVLEPGDLSLTDGTSTCEASWPGGGGTKLVLIDYDRLGLPVDLVRRAVPHLSTSPVYQLVRAHVANMFDGNGDAELGPAEAMLRVATIELVRALITTAAQDELGQRVLHDTLYLRVSKYVDAHLTAPDLNAESIALAHNVSVRTLYNAWSAAACARASPAGLGSPPRRGPGSSW